MEFYFAPMEGITSYTYRNLHHRFFGGVEKYYTPFLSPSAENGLSTRELKDVLPENNGEIRLSAGKTAQTESLEQLKEILEAQGEQQQELLEEMSGNIRELSRNAQKGKFGLFR